MCEEWGDKSQIAAIALAANYGFWSIIIGGALVRAVNLTPPLGPRNLHFYRFSLGSCGGAHAERGLSQPDRGHPLCGFRPLRVNL